MCAKSEIEPCRSNSRVSTRKPGKYYARNRCLYRDIKMAIIDFHLQHCIMHVAWKVQPTPHAQSNVGIHTIELLQTECGL